MRRHNDPEVPRNGLEPIRFNAGQHHLTSRMRMHLGRIRISGTRVSLEEVSLCSQEAKKIIVASREA